MDLTSLASGEPTLTLLIRFTQMSIFERHLFVTRVKKAIEKKKRDLRAMNLEGAVDTDSRKKQFDLEYWFDGGEVRQQLWEDWVCEALEETRPARRAHRLASGDS